MWGLSAAGNERAGGAVGSSIVREGKRRSSSARGEYSDSNHPGCPRFVVATATPNALRVVGHDGDAQNPWSARLVVTGDGLVEADFSAKRGPAALVGEVNSATGDITWADGGTWRWVRDVPVSDQLPPPVRVGYGDTGTTPLDVALVAADDVKCGWKANEVLIGPCPGSALAPVHAASGAPYPSAEACAAACCALATCRSWQYRSDAGCQHGGDVRLGMEKDGVTAWCEPSPPHPWVGERLLERAAGAIVVDRRAAACGAAWTSPEKPLRGQCFGLGAQRNAGGERTDHAWSRASHSAELCRQACCNGRKGACETWQWRADKGCFFGGPASCREVNSGVEFLPFAGRRKVTPGRTYTDQHGAAVLPLRHA